MKQQVVSGWSSQVYPSVVNKISQEHFEVVQHPLFESEWKIIGTAALHFTQMFNWMHNDAMQMRNIFLLIIQYRNQDTVGEIDFFICSDSKLLQQFLVPALNLWWLHEYVAPPPCVKHSYCIYEYIAFSCSESSAKHANSYK